MQNAVRERLNAGYPVFAALGASADAALSEHAWPLSAPAGAVLFHEESPCVGFPLVLSGAIRVARGSPGGRSLELYRVTAGELCVVSTACLLGQAPLSAHGQALQATDMVMLSPAGFELLSRHDAFRRFVFGTFAARLADLMALAEAVAFQRLDQRLAHALLGHGSQVHATHQALADELGTVREIVSRLLSRFERAGWVQLSRECIQVLGGPALRTLASGQQPPAAV